MQPDMKALQAAVLASYAGISQQPPLVQIRVADGGLMSLEADAADLLAGGSNDAASPRPSEREPESIAASGLCNLQHALQAADARTPTAPAHRPETNHGRLDMESEERAQPSRVAGLRRPLVSAFPSQPPASASPASASTG